MNERQPQTQNLSKRAKVVGALGIATGLLLASGALSDNPERSRAPIYQPADTQPTPFGTEVPEGFQAPVGEMRSPVPGHPDQELVQYGTSPDGQTLPDKIVSVPPSSIPS